MNLNHLKYFSDAASSGSLSAAAKQNRVSQSAISQAIVALENHLDCQLIFHKRNRFQLTEAGNLASQECKQVFESLDRLKSKVSDQESEIRGELKFAAINSIAGSLLSPVLAQLQKDFPAIRLKMRLGNSEVIQKWILDKEIDLGFIVDEPLLKSLDSKTLLSGRYKLFRAHRNHSSLERNGVIVTRSERPEVQNLIAYWKKRAGAHLKIQMEVTSWEIIRKLVLAGMGVGLCPDYVLEDDLRNRRIQVVNCLGWRYNYQVSAVHLGNRELSRASRLLLDTMK